MIEITTSSSISVKAVVRRTLFLSFSMSHALHHMLQGGCSVRIPSKSVDVNKDDLECCGSTQLWIRCSYSGTIHISRAWTFT